MAETKIYPKGLRTFPKNEKAPDFVLGTLIISPNDLNAWIRENENYLTEYNGSKQLKLQMLKGDKGIYFTVDTYKPTPANGLTNKAVVEDDLPF